MRQNRFFYKTGVDIHNVKQMFNFIKNHCTYYTLNPWNNLCSIANNVKVYNLHLDGSWSTALALLADECDTYGIQDTLATMIHHWEVKHSGYIVYFNGRSDGYLVLGNEHNMRGVIPDSIRGARDYEEFKCDLHNDGYLVEDMFFEMRDLVALIRDFDILCDDMREALNFAVIQKELYYDMQEEEE